MKRSILTAMFGLAALSSAAGAQELGPEAKVWGRNVSVPGYKFASPPSPVNAPFEEQLSEIRRGALAQAQEEVRSILKGGGSAGPARVAGTPAQAQGEAGPRMIRCTTKKLQQVPGGPIDVDIVFTARVVSNEVLEQATMRNEAALRATRVSAARVEADRAYKPGQAGRKNMNRFYLGSAPDDDDYPYGDIAVYLPKNMTSLAAPRGELEVSRADDGDRGTLSCAFK